VNNQLRQMRRSHSTQEADMAEVSFAATTPVHVGKVGLKARDGQALADYYKSVVGLKEISRRPGVIVLGAGDDGFFEIEEIKGLKQDDPRSAGLFHTAFLLPKRADLARWTRHATDNQIQIDGASDHLVSEAIYLTDPEGNGIEIYADRAPSGWKWDGANVRMATERLNFPDLMTEITEATEEWTGAPDASMVGHVHLRVGDSKDAEAWWHEEMRFDTVAHYGGAAVFLSTGGYHHHIGANVWHSKGAGKRDLDRTGLGWVEMKSKAGQTKTVSDPWGTEIRVVAA
jgi:catechol 2,3-dioxygenase